MVIRANVAECVQERMVGWGGWHLSTRVPPRMPAHTMRRDAAYGEHMAPCRPVALAVSRPRHSDRRGEGERQRERKGWREGERERERRD